MKTNHISEEKEVSISVVVPVYNEETLLPLCLDALINQNFFQKYEIIVVDNGSTDKSKEIANRYPVKIISETKKGVASARQRGFSEARGKIIASTDADTIPENGWLEKINSYFTNNPSSLAVTGSWYFFGKKRFVCVFLNIICPLVIFYNRIVFGSFLGGSNFAIKKNAFDKIGGFNTKLLVYEDVDLARRLKKTGKIGYEKTLRVTTSARKWEESFSSFEKLKALWMTYFVNHSSIVLIKKPIFNRFFDIRSKTENDSIAPNNPQEFRKGERI